MPKSYDTHVKNMQKAKVLAARITEQVQRRAGAGVKAAAIFLAARLKETVSVPAPRKRVVSGMGDISYRATMRAVRGAPPRKLSGRLRQSITYAMFIPNRGTKPTAAVVGVKARSLKGFNYPKHLERRGHPFMAPTVRRWRTELRAIVGRFVRIKTP